MNSPEPAIVDSTGPRWWHRYETSREAYHEKFLHRWENRFPRLRNRRAARKIVVALAITIGLTVTAAIGTFFTTWSVLPFLVLVAVLLSIVWILRVITLNVNDAPAASLDEFQLAGRNAARSIAYTALWASMFIPYILLLAVSRGGNSSVSGEVIYGSAVLLIVLVTAATCIPAGLAAWWLQDRDPEDFEAFPQQTASDLADSATETGGPHA